MPWESEVSSRAKMARAWAPSECWATSAGGGWNPVVSSWRAGSAPEGPAGPAPGEVRARHWDTALSRSAALGTTRLTTLAGKPMLSSWSSSTEVEVAAPAAAEEEEEEEKEEEGGCKKSLPGGRGGMAVGGAMARPWSPANAGGWWKDERGAKSMPADGTGWA